MALARDPPTAASATINPIAASVRAYPVCMLLPFSFLGLPVQVPFKKSFKPGHPLAQIGYITVDIAAKVSNIGTHFANLSTKGVLAHDDPSSAAFTSLSLTDEIPGHRTPMPAPLNPARWP